MVSECEHMSIKYQSNTKKLEEEFHDWWTGRIKEQKEELSKIANEYAAHVSANLPVGPSHRVGILPGTLKASERVHINDSGDQWEASITVGTGTDYWQYVQAQQGGTFWTGDEPYIDRMDRALKFE